MKKVTIKQLAEILGVSISTVSKALNNSYEISDATRKRVVETAEIYGYFPNPIARRLKYGKTYTLGVILPTIQDNFFVRVLHGIEEEIYNTEYNIITCSTRNVYTKEVELIHNLSGIVDGFIIAPAKETILKQDFRHFRKAIKMGKPILMFDRIINSIDCSTIESNNINAVFNATIQLIDKGRNNIVIACNNELSTDKDRIKGYIKALQRTQIDFDSNLILKIDPIDFKNRLKKILNDKTIDAIICTDEDSTYEVLKVIKFLGKKIPEEISIIAYIDEKIAQNLEPEITTINQHRKTIGETAVKTLISQIEEEKSLPKRIKLNSTLYRRASF